MKNRMRSSKMYLIKKLQEEQVGRMGGSKIQKGDGRGKFLNMNPNIEKFHWILIRINRSKSTLRHTKVKLLKSKTMRKISKLLRMRSGRVKGREQITEKKNNN